MIAISKGKRQSIKTYSNENSLVLLLVQHSQGVELLGHQVMVRPVAVHVDVQGLFVEGLGGGELAPLGVQPRQLVVGPGHDGVVWVQGNLPNLQRPL